MAHQTRRVGLPILAGSDAYLAVVANGRYFNRAALDQLFADVRTASHKGVAYWSSWPSPGMRTRTIEEWRRGWEAIKAGR